MCGYQKFVLILVTGWVRVHGDTAASYSLGYWIQQPLTLTLLKLSKTLFLYSLLPLTTSLLTAEENEENDKPYV